METSMYEPEMLMLVKHRLWVILLVSHAKHIG